MKYCLAIDSLKKTTVQSPSPAVSVGVVCWHLHFQSTSSPLVAYDIIVAHASIHSHEEKDVAV